MRQLLFISFLLFPVITLAGGSSPWCLILDEVEVCGFADAEACYDKAQYGGYCRQNVQFMGVTGDRRWCVITATRRSCNYVRGVCLQVAAELGGGCVENTELALKEARTGAWAGAGAEADEGDFEFEENVIVDGGMSGGGM